MKHFLTVYTRARTHTHTHREGSVIEKSERGRSGCVILKPKLTIVPLSCVYLKLKIACLEIQMEDYFLSTNLNFFTLKVTISSTFEIFSSKNLRLKYICYPFNDRIYTQALYLCGISISTFLLDFFVLIF